MPSTSGTRPSLIAQAKLQSADAWQQIVYIYSPLIRAWGRKLGCTAEESDDLCQDVLTAAAKSLPQFQPDGVGGSFRGWLWKIAYRKWIDSRRVHQRNEPAIGGSTAMLALYQIVDPIDAADSGRQPEELSSALMIQSVLQRAMKLVRSEFNDTHWQAFWMSTVEGQSTDLIADRLKLSPANVRQARSRILRRLRVVMGDSIEESSQGSASPLDRPKPSTDRPT